jgi:hypothetical protein
MCPVRSVTHVSGRSSPKSPVISALSCFDNPVSRCLNKPRTVPKSPVGLGNARAVCSTDVLQSDFEPLEHSVYVGRRSLGRYERIGKRKYAAYDSSGRLLGRFTKLANAQKAFDRLAAGGGER